MNIIQKLHIRLNQLGDLRACVKDLRVPRKNLSALANAISKTVMVPTDCEYLWPDNAPCFRTVLYYDNTCGLSAEVSSESSVCEHHECCKEMGCPYYSNHCAYMKALNDFNVAHLAFIVAKRNLFEPIGKN